LQTIIELLDQAGRSSATGGALESALVAELLAVAEELCVARDRLDTAIRLSAEGRPVTIQAIDEHPLSEADIERRLAGHTAFYEGLYRRLSQSLAQDQPG
jgi:hypothetical protein